MMNNAKWAEYKSGAFKAKNILDSAMKMYHVKNGEIPLCGYWEKNPYSGTVKCVSYDANDVCTKHTLNDEPIPSDYNGHFNDCSKVYDFLLNNLNVAKYCKSNAFNNGCIPHYDGTDIIAKKKYPNKTDEDISKETASSSGLRTENIKKS